jgi:hypothetical protein
MQDMIAAGEAWFEQKRRDHLSVFVEYLPAGSLLSRTCHATLVIGRWQAVDAAGQMIRSETRDFFIHRDELPADPKRGDKVTVTENGASQVYEVSIPEGSQFCWQWADRSQKVRRIHTMATTHTPATTSPALLVVCVGASTATAITDTEIKSQLTAQLQSSRTLTRTVVAASQYVYLVVPASFGTLLVNVNGLQVTAWQTAVRPITFDGQAARDYQIYRSLYPVAGSISIGVS